MTHRVRVTEIGEFISHQSCHRRFKLAYDNMAIYKRLPFSDRPFHVLDPVLQAVASRREDEWAAGLVERGLTPLAEELREGRAIAWEHFAHSLAGLAPGQEAFAREVGVSGLLGAFVLDGRIDFVVCRQVEGRPRLQLVECKSSRKDRTYHRVQVTLYRLLVLDWMARFPLEACGVTLGPDDLDVLVVRVDEDSGQIQSILDQRTFPQAAAIATDARHLLEAGGLLDQILRTELDTLPFKLDGKCDDCLFSVHCLAESARQRRLELLGVNPTCVRALRRVGVPDLDVLADLDLDSDEAGRIRSEPEFMDNLEELVARARARRSTLPRPADREDDPTWGYQVQNLPFSGYGRVPPHETDGQPLVRVYLTVSYDYVEDRLIALAAHITDSPWRLLTPFGEQDAEGKSHPVPEVLEQHVEWQDRKLVELGRRPARGIDVVSVQQTHWEGSYDRDTGSEMQLVHGFLRQVVAAIEQIADTRAAVPLHFFIWSRAEMTRLMEACSRVSSSLLGHLRQLLGCRESLEQLIYSVLQDELFGRHAIGWTGRGQVVAESLTWFGQRYHWHRRFGYHDSVVELDRVFHRDIFDFRTMLDLDADGQWCKEGDPGATAWRFEVRSRFHDSLSAPYWHAYWRTLPPASAFPGRGDVQKAIADYDAASRKGLLDAYLIARAQGLRWLDDRLTKRNKSIAKPPIPVRSLPTFQLGTRNAAEAAEDFLRFDGHVKRTDWYRYHMSAPYVRVSQGRSLPLRDLRQLNRPVPGKTKRTGEPYVQTVIVGVIDAARYGIVLASAVGRFSWAEGDFVRLTPSVEDLHAQQSYNSLRYGKTCVIDTLDWATGAVELLIVPNYEDDPYILHSAPFDDLSPLAYRHTPTFATLDESPSDFVAGKVEQRLAAPIQGGHAVAWLDPVHPAIPPAPALPTAERDALRAWLQTLTFGAASHTLDAERVEALIEGLETRIELMQGPPGTGKTQMTALAILTRVLARHKAGDVLLVASHTHTAVDTLLARVQELVAGFRAQAQAAGLDMPPIDVVKVHSSRDDAELHDGLYSKSCVQEIARRSKGAVLVIGGTISTTLKMVTQGLNSAKRWQGTPDGFLTPLLVVDEASMMVFAHFLALATLVRPDGHIMLAGDHRQLSPIVAHDWDAEDRPPTVLYKPHVSAFEAIVRLSAHPKVDRARIGVHRLSTSYRLPPELRALIQPLYAMDDIALRGGAGVAVSRSAFSEPWEAVWRSGHRLYLLLHDEQQSQQSNRLEAELVRRVIEAAGPLGPASVAVVTPHRSQRALLKQALAGVAEAVDVIDTVERLQGGERPTIVFSATVSDPVMIAQNVEFILDLNRSNVAFSRARERLVVIASRTLLDHVPAMVEHYESAMLWKWLRTMCQEEVVRGEVDGVGVRCLVPSAVSQPAVSVTARR